MSNSVHGACTRRRPQHRATHQTGVDPELLIPLRFEATTPQKLRFWRRNSTGGRKQIAAGRLEPSVSLVEFELKARDTSLLVDR